VLDSGLSRMPVTARRMRQAALCLSSRGGWVQHVGFRAFANAGDGAANETGAGLSSRCGGCSTCWDSDWV